MDAEIDLSTADRDVLIAIIERQQAIIESLEKRIAQLEGRDKLGGTRRMPGLKPKAEQQPAQPRVPVQVTEHAYIARTCPQCQRCCTPTAQLENMVMGKQRLGVNLISLIAALREEARLPFRTIQWYLDTVHGLRLSLGAIVDATQRVACKAQAELTGILERIRGSPVVHADETGWREDGHNGYVWTFSTPSRRYFLRRGRGKAVVDEVLGDQFAGVLVSDFYAAYHHYDGPKQRCWAHLLRDIHDLRALYPDDDRLAQWADAIHHLTRSARRLTLLLPQRWPWEAQFNRALARLRALPSPA